jgi:ABC-type uncharacterized transport system involved in gliding motility auxiliary subunit
MALEPSAALERRRAARERCLCLLLSGLLALQCLRLARDHAPARIDLSAEGLSRFSPATEQVLAELPDLASVEAYFTRDLEHAALALLRARLVDQLESLEALSKGRLELRFFDPSSDSAARLEATERYRLEPIDVDAVAGATRVTQEVFLGLVIKHRGRQEVLPLVLPDSLEVSLVGALRRLARPRAPRIGLLASAQFAPGLEPLRQALAARYEFSSVSGLDQGLAVPPGLDALVVAAPVELPPRAVWELERYLAQGGALLIAADRCRALDRELSMQAYATGLESWLGRLGAELSGDLCWDLDSAARIQASGGRGQPLDYPLMLNLRGDSLVAEHALTARLPAVLLQWASPIELRPGGGLEPVLQSSPRAFRVPVPDKLGFESEAVALYSRQLIASQRAERMTLLAAGVGPFPAPAEEPPPVLDEQGAPQPAAAGALEDRSGPGRLILVGDANWLLPLDASGRPAPQNLALFENAVDWLCADELLLALRARRVEPRSIRDFLAEERERRGLAGPSGAVARARGELDASELAADRAAARRRAVVMAATGALGLIVPAGLLLAAWRRSRAPVWRRG